MNKLKRIGSLLLPLLIGVLVGGYLFSDTRPRSFLALNHCEGNCLQPNELLGLLASVGIQKFPFLVPGVIKETDKVIVMRHPSPQARMHYLVIPKKDVKHVGDLSDSDRDYLVESFGVMREIIKENSLVNYRIITNGPGYQGVTYLHFHLTAQ
jgi:histidine triad (HIT) family protein